MDLAENDFEKIKCFDAKIFEKGDYIEFLYSAVMLLHKSKMLKDESQKSSKQKPIQYEKFLVVKRNILLGIGTEYLLKAIFLKNGFGINRIKPIRQLQEPYKVGESITTELNECETVTFWYLKKHILKIVDCSEFDNNVKQKNKTLRKKDEERKRKDKEANVKSLNSEYKRPHSEGCLNLIEGIRNNHSHNAFIKLAFNGFFENAFEFLDFLTKSVFSKEIQQLFDEYKPELDKEI